MPAMAAAQSAASAVAGTPPQAGAACEEAEHGPRNAETAGTGARRHGTDKRAANWREHRDRRQPRRTRSMSECRTSVDPLGMARCADHPSWRSWSNCLSTTRSFVRPSSLLRGAPHKFLLSEKPGLSFGADCLSNGIGRSASPPHATDVIRCARPD